MCKTKNIHFEDKDLLLLDVFCGGASIMYQHYILGKYDLSPKQAGHLLYQMFPENLNILVSIIHISNYEIAFASLPYVYKYHFVVLNLVGLPCSKTTPSFKTTIWSTPSTVLIRCAIINTVLFSINLEIDS